MTEILIRKAGKSDNLPIQRLISTYFLDMEDLEPEDFLLAEVEGKITGCAAFIKSECQENNFIEIHSIAVHPNFRGKGIGTRLIKHILKDLSSSTCEIYVRTTSPAFFEKMNFAKIENSQKLSLWEDCKQCEYFDKCTQYAMKYLSQP
jgi:amino-acid N-acetyltransferase